MQDSIILAHRHAAQWLGLGTAATFIPELTKQNPNQLGICITTCQGEQYRVGDSQVKFTMQSISKLVLLALALEDSGFDTVFSRVGMEPSGDRFNSIYRLELSDKKPSNPMINAGAIAVSGCISGDNTQQRAQRVFDLAKRCMGVDTLERSSAVFQCEVDTGHRNRALAHMMRDNGVLFGSVDSHLEVYYHACSMLVDSEMLSFFGALLANGGNCPRTGVSVLSKDTAYLLRVLMATCGLYDRSGEFAFRVGVPAKSGSAGGIMACVPGRMGIGTFSPLLDEKGNSICGMKALEYLSSLWNLPIY